VSCCTGTPSNVPVRVPVSKLPAARQQVRSEIPDTGPDVAVGHQDRQIGLDVPGLVAAIIALAVEPEAVERLVADQLRHRVLAANKSEA
jgi:hypothetical protein